MIEQLTPEDKKALVEWDRQTPRGLKDIPQNYETFIDAIEKQFAGKFTVANLNWIAWNDPRVIYEPGLVHARRPQSFRHG